MDAAKKKKMMILVVAGQSNAVGYDESPVTAEDLFMLGTGRLFQLGVHGADNLRVMELGVCAQSYQDMRPYGNPANPGVGTKGVHLPLAHALLAMIPEDYGILVISCAYGGSGFTVGEYGAYDTQAMLPAPGVWRWGVQSGYYKGMKDRIAHALSLCDENRFLGVLWCQGEHDSADAAGQKAGFEAMTEDFFASFEAAFPGRVYRGGWNRGIWYNVETVGYWYAQGQCARIWENYRRWNPETYVEIPRGTSSNEKDGTGITAKVRAQHFGGGAYRDVVAPRIAQAMGERLKGE